MRKILSLLPVFLCVSLFAQRTGQAQQNYIDTYSEIAIQEMMRTGVPASITLAQGILESGSGLSTLAVNGKNHFGIKCHKGWTGDTMYMDDDRRGECFRVYNSVEESFRDHSDFLRYRDRYKFLFELERTDYKGWAVGLKKAGYATDPKYATKLIKYIEDYNLSRFDILTTQEEAVVPESPLQIEQPVAAPEVRNGVSVPASEQFHFQLSRLLYSLNDVPFVYSMEGETYASIAKQYHLFKWEILRYNDLRKEQPLLPGSVVYLEAKKKKAPKGLDMYIVSEDGESFHDICQRFAVKEKAILKLNGWIPPVELEEGDEIKLR
ncbi:MAG: glucosaminidase domain-containing protein [Bacteroidales bacterium]|nr:glucosaminidase domain-containing protein [Bacteroidales bacterium]